MKLLHNKQTAALTRLFALGMVLGPAMADGLAEQGLTTARAELIWRLHGLGPMNQRQLSEALQCTPRNVTGLVDALEVAGMVERRPHPDDRRATLVTLTDEGQAAAEKWNTSSDELAGELFKGIDSNDLATFVATLDLILERLGAPVPVPDPARSS